MNRYRLHRIQFYKLEPKAIQSLSYDDISHKLAVGRVDCNIEIWNLEHTPCQESIIPCTSENAAESITWCCSRLFSVGFNAYITEYDLIRLAPKYSLPVTTGPSWCIAANKQETTLAVGTENGYICLFLLTDEGLSYSDTFTKQEGRVVCLAWHPSGETIVSGSADRIQIWNVKTGTILESIIVGSMERNVQTLVWCVAVTSDNTILSGDSWGRMSFWDGETATQLHTIKSHNADILSLCINKDENSVYASGIDPIIIEFVKVQTHSSGRQQWLKSVQRRLHTHDVRALALAGKYLVSGGIDTYLSLSKYPPKLYLNYPALPQKPIAQVAQKAHCLLCKYPQALEIWKLGTTKAAKGEDADIMPLDSDVKKLLRLETKKREVIVSCAISDCGNWLAYSTTEQLRLYYFSIDSVSACPTLQKLKSLPKKCSSAHMLAFTPSGEHLVIVTPSQSLQVMKIDLIRSVLEHNIPHFSENALRYCLLSLSNDGHLAACGDVSGNVIIYNILYGKIHCKLPHHKCQPTSMAFHPRTNNLLVAYSDHKLVEYCPKEAAYTPWSRHQPSLDRLGFNLHSAVVGITFDPKNANIILLYDDTRIFLIDKEQTKDNEASKRRRINFDTTLTKSRSFKHLGFFGSMCEDQLVVVEITPEQITDSLVPALRQKKFGT